MMPPLTWPQRLARQVFPRRDVRECCYYHRQDFHAIAATASAATGKCAAAAWTGTTQTN